MIKVRTRVASRPRGIVRPSCLVRERAYLEYGVHFWLKKDVEK